MSIAFVRAGVYVRAVSALRRSTAAPRIRRGLRCRAGEIRPGEGDFGARDPFPEEVASNFGEKVLGPADTEHIIKPPDAMGDVVGLKARKCVPCEGGTPALEEKDIERLRNQVPGWQLVQDDAGHYKIKSDWEMRGFKSALEFFGRVAEIANSEGHHPDLHLTSYRHVCIELSTHAVNGLTENDFIIAAKINALDVTDLLRKKKQSYWA